MINVYRKLRVSLLQQIFNTPIYTMWKNDVCKTIRQEIYAVYYDIKCTIALTCECVLVVLSRKTVYFGISKRVLYFHNVFLPHAQYFLLFTFTTVLSRFRFFVIDRTRYAASQTI